MNKNLLSLFGIFLICFCKCSIAQLQTTWVKTPSFSSNFQNSSYNNPLAVGPIGFAIRTDGKYFVLNKDNQGGDQTLYLMDGFGNILNSILVGHYGSGKRETYSIITTPDNGCMYIEHYFYYNELETYTIYKVNSGGDSIRVIRAWQNNGSIPPPKPSLVIPTHHIAYYCNFNGIYIRFPYMDTLNGTLNKVFLNDDRLISNGSFKRTNSFDSTLWEVSNDGYGIVACSENYFYAIKDSLRRFDSNSGNIIWTKKLPATGNYYYQYGIEGLIVMSGRTLTVIDSSGNVSNIDTIKLTLTNPSSTATLLDGSILTGGGYKTFSWYTQYLNYNSLIIKLNSEGKGVADSTDIYYSGDADQDNTEAFVDDAVVIAAALGHSTTYRNVNNWGYPLYGELIYNPDWDQSFESSLNYKYSDANQDGKVDLNDLKFMDSYQIYHPTPAPSNWLHKDINGVPIKIFCENSNFSIGDTIIIDVILGSLNHPIDSIYGVAINFFPKDTTGRFLSLKYISRDIVNNVLGDTTSNLIVYRGDTNSTYWYNTILACRNDHQNISLTGDTLFRFKAIVNTNSFLGNYTFDAMAHIIIKGGFTIPTSIISDTLNIILKTSELEKNYSLNIFPNPASGQIKILNNELSIKKILIHDINGAIVYENKNGNKTIDVSYLSDGVYIVECKSDKGNYYSKLLVQH